MTCWIYVFIGVVSAVVSTGSAYPRYCSYSYDSYGYRRTEYVFCRYGCCYGGSSTYGNCCYENFELDVGSIVGIVFGALFGLACMIAFVCCCAHACKKSSGRGAVVAPAPFVVATNTYQQSSNMGYTGYHGYGQGPAYPPPTAPSSGQPPF